MHLPIPEDEKRASIVRLHRTTRCGRAYYLTPERHVDDMLAEGHYLFYIGFSYLLIHDLETALPLLMLSLRAAKRTLEEYGFAVTIMPGPDVRVIGPAQPDPSWGLHSALVTLRDLYVAQWLLCEQPPSRSWLAAVPDGAYLPSKYEWLREDTATTVMQELVARGDTATARAFMEGMPPIYDLPADGDYPPYLHPLHLLAQLMSYLNGAHHLRKDVAEGLDFWLAFCQRHDDNSSAMFWSEALDFQQVHESYLPWPAERVYWAYLRRIFHGDRHPSAKSLIEDLRGFTLQEYDAYLWEYYSPLAQEMS